MQRRMFLLALVLSLLVVFASTAGVMADKGSLPHDGGCAAYCARAVVHELIDGDWVPVDVDKDGKLETCLREFGPLDPMNDMCIKWGRGGCPEVLADGEKVEYDRCVLPEDDWGFWCRLMHGEDMHGEDNDGHTHGRGR